MKNAISLEKILGIGIFIRFLIFIFLSPTNNDGHFPIIQYIINNHKTPISGALNQAFHPPLYHLLASLLKHKILIHFLSFILSALTLLIFYWLIKKIKFINPYINKLFCLLLPSLHPSFIMFSSYISNDGLSFFLGALIFLQMYLVLKKPSLKNQIALSIYLGLGLLTKGTLIFFVPIIFLFLLIVNIKNDISIKKIFLRILLASLLIFSIGSYKYIENIYNYGKPVIHNLDFKHAWADKQRPTYKGFFSFIDLNISKLIFHPTISDHTKHSYPLMLYGSLWYQYIPESNFKGNLTKFKYLGSLIYIFALIISLLFIIGFFKIFLIGKSIFYFKKLSSYHFNKIIYQISLLLIFLTTLIMIIFIGKKYDVWSCFQSRLLYSSYFSLILFLNQGIKYIQNKESYVKKFVYLSLICLFTCFIIYFGSEIVGQIFYKFKLIPDFIHYKQINYAYNFF